MCGGISRCGDVWKVEEWEGSGAAGSGDGVVGCGGCGIGGRLYIGISWYRGAITLFLMTDEAGDGQHFVSLFREKMEVRGHGLATLRGLYAALRNPSSAMRLLSRLRS